MLVPAPPMNLVMACTTTSAPYSIGPEKDRRCHSVIDDQRYAVFVGDFRDSLDVGDVSRRISDTFAIDRTRVFVDQLFDVFGPVGHGKTRLDAALRKNMCEKGISRPIKLRSGNDIVPGFEDIDQGILNCGHSGADAQTIDSAFQSCHSLLEHCIRRIADSSVDIPLNFQVEKGSPMLRAVELERYSLIDRDSDCLGRRVAVISDVNCNRFRLHSFAKMSNATLLRSGCCRFGSEPQRLSSKRLRHSLGHRARSEIGSECESHDWSKTIGRRQPHEVQARN